MTKKKTAFAVAGEELRKLGYRGKLTRSTMRDKLSTLAGRRQLIAELKGKSTGAPGSGWTGISRPPRGKAWGKFLRRHRQQVGTTGMKDVARKYKEEERKLRSIEDFAKKLAATAKGKKEQIFVMRDAYRGRKYVRIGSNIDRYMDIAYNPFDNDDHGFGPSYEVIDGNVFGQEIYGDLSHMKRLMTYFVNKAQDLPYEAIHYGELPDWVWEWSPNKKNPASQINTHNIAAVALGALAAHHFLK